MPFAPKNGDINLLILLFPVCRSQNIRYFRDLLKLRGCNVIEGDLRISVMDDPIKLRRQCNNYNILADDDRKNCDTFESLNNLTFPELREVTDYVALYQTKAITTLSTLFPNLAVIRGNQLIKVIQ